MSQNKRFFGYIEVAFDIIYLLAALILGIYMIFNAINSSQMLAGSAAIVLVFGDSFHLIPRIMSILNNKTDYTNSLGIGKLITSITMTVFYLILWHIGVHLFSAPQIATKIIYIFAVVRIILCLFPQNKWLSKNPPVNWGILRNIPFLLEGIMVMVLFFINRNIVSGISFIWLAILLSFAFYLPVVLWAHKNPKIGMLMLPKTVSYVWLLIMLLSI